MFRIKIKLINTKSFVDCKEINIMRNNFLYIVKKNKTTVSQSRFSFVRLSANTLCALVVKKINHEVARRKFTKGHEGRNKFNIKKMFHINPNCHAVSGSS